MHKWLLPLIVLLFCSCEKNEKVTHLRGVAMTMPYHIQIGDKLSGKQKKIAQTAISSTFLVVDNTMNHWNPRSELSNLNYLPTNTPVLITKYLSHLLAIAKEVHTLSEGRFDPTHGLTISKWKGALLSQELPSNIPLDGGFENIVLTETSFEKQKAVHIDLDGIAKGYAVDLLIETLQQAGFKNLYVNWGGEIRTTGTHPEGRPWQVLVASTGKVIPLRECAIATSGNTLQHCQIQGTIYSHYIDPTTQRAMPQTKARSITVIAPTCALADGLATSAMLIADPKTLLSWQESITTQFPTVEFLQ